ncbi:hypothetical protein ACIU1J_24025 [Azospirillum doebereinerae]|uniref:hypothetical protein n=1 Tax=Azospirillum doebereinerae TaxID=92933 RepID=UPI001EE570AE|nr:hypothetical protein [Azospirillum doebereinerae]
MLPVLTFASGLIAGIVGVQLLKKTKLADEGAAARLDKTRAGLRRAAVSGLAAMETSSAGLRAKLTPAEATAEAPPVEPAEPAVPGRDQDA